MSFEFTISLICPFDSETESASHTLPAFHTGRPTVGNNNFLCDREAKPCPCLGRLIGSPEELFEDMRKVLIGDPDPGVGDLEADRLLFDLGRDGDAAPGEGIFRSNRFLCQQ